MSEMSKRKNIMLLFSAHPDDEVLSFGPIALRARKEGWNVINVAVTLGSDESQQDRRIEEVQNACGHLRIKVHIPHGAGLDVYASRDSEEWSENVTAILDILYAHAPDVVAVHHENDWHPAHIHTNILVHDALEQIGWNGAMLESQYWHDMFNPNVLLEVPSSDLDTLMGALKFHTGELERNPFDKSFEGLLRFNVCRAEKVLVKGSRAPEWEYAMSYRLSLWAHGEKRVSQVPLIISESDGIDPIMER